MKYRRLDPRPGHLGDYSFGQGMQDFCQDTDAVDQAIYTNLKLLSGEWWEDTSAGLPLFQSILGQANFKKDIADMIIRDQILATQGVASIQSFASQYANREYSVICTVVASTGGAVTVGVSW